MNISRLYDNGHCMVEPNSGRANGEQFHFAAASCRLMARGRPCRRCEATKHDKNIPNPIPPDELFQITVLALAAAVVLICNTRAISPHKVIKEKQRVKQNTGRKFEVTAGAKSVARIGAM